MHQIHFHSINDILDDLFHQLNREEFTMKTNEILLTCLVYTYMILFSRLTL